MVTITRAAHLQWCKDRALELLKTGSVQLAFASFNSDMSKHPETDNHSAMKLGLMLFLEGHLNTVTKMKKWINGFG